MLNSWPRSKWMTELVSWVPRSVTASVLSMLLLAVADTSMIGCGVSGAMPSPSGSASSLLATAPVDAPVSGYAWDSSGHGLRPILGATGASFVSAPILSNPNYVASAFSLAGSYALITDLKNDILLAALPSGTPIQVSGPLSAKQQIAVSPLGRAALIYALDTTKALLLQGLPGALQTKAISLPLGVSAGVVSDSGLIVIATNQADGSTTVSSLETQSGFTQVTSIGQLGGLAFLPGSSSALIADVSQNAVLLASSLDSSARVTRVASAVDGIASPLAIASSSDGHWAIVANRAGSILRIDLLMQSHPESIDCNCSPSTLAPIAGNGVFRLTELGQGPLRIFDGDSTKLRVVFAGGVQNSTAGAAERVK